MDLKEKFQTGEVVLPGIDVKVSLAPNQFYRDDGIVRDINIHGKHIEEELYKNSYFSTEKFGHCLYNHNLGKNKIFIVTAVQKTNDLTDIFNQGHESIHALCRLGKKKEFIKELQKYNFQINPFEKFSDEEHQAHVGGLFSLYKQGKLDLEDSKFEGEGVEFLNKIYGDFVGSKLN